MSNCGRPAPAARAVAGAVNPKSIMPACWHVFKRIMCIPLPVSRAIAIAMATGRQVMECAMFGCFTARTKAAEQQPMRKAR